MRQLAALTIALFIALGAAPANAQIMPHVSGVRFFDRAGTAPCSAGQMCLWRNGTTLNLRLPAGTDTALGAGGGGSTGNWTFSGNIADLVANGVMQVGSTHATTVLIGSNPSGGVIIDGGTLSVQLQTASSTRWSVTSAGGHLVPFTDNAYDLGSSTLRVRNGYFNGIQLIPNSNGISNTAQSATNTTAMTIAPNVADGASSVGLNINMITAMTSGKMLTLSSNGTLRASIMHDGFETIIKSESLDLMLRDASNNGFVASNAVGGGYLAVGGANTYGFSASSWRPSTDNSSSDGDLTHRWKGVFNSGGLSCKYNLQSGTTYTAVAGDCWVVMSNAAAKTVTMPAANALPAGGIVYMLDGSANASTQNINVARAGTDTINGGTTTIAVVTANNAHSTCVTDGTSKWICGVNN